MRIPIEYRYGAELIILEDKSYRLEFVDFDIAAEGDTKEEVLRNAKEVLALEIKDYLDSGKELPVASKKDGLDDRVYIMVDEDYLNNEVKDVTVNITIPVTLPQWLNIQAIEKKLNFSDILLKGIKAELAKG